MWHGEKNCLDAVYKVENKDFFDEDAKRLRSPRPH